MKSTLIILTRNEIAGTRALFDNLPIKEVDEVFVIDFQSQDGTPKYFRERGVRVVEQVKKGRGEAFRLGAEIATGDILIYFSPDGNEDPKDIIALKKLIEDGADMSIASRFTNGSRNEEDDSILPLRAWANRAFTLLGNLFFGGNVTDSINGFRAIRKDKFFALNLDAEGFAIEYQMTLRALKAGYKIMEIPTIESNRIGGESTAHAIPTGLKVLRVLIREIINT